MTDCTMQLHATVTVWPKGQVVIPAEVRKLLHIFEGDKLAVITKGEMAVWFVKTEHMPSLLAYLQEATEQQTAI